MKSLRKAGATALLAGALVVAVPPASAVESDPLPVPSGTPREKAVTTYNEGVVLLLDKRYAAAQAKFEAALAQDEKLAEAHNNLAFSLRMQGAQNFDRSLKHYNRALELKPELAQAYMYRGVLFAQMGDVARARADYERLLRLDPSLAAELEAVIVGRAGGYGRAGISAQFD
jgi:tetratricopeptide (TPR) repeat protein